MKKFISLFAILLFCSSIRSNKLCDRSDSSLEIDSAVAIASHGRTKIMLFSGHMYYESEELAVGDKSWSNFKAKNISETFPEFIPPVDTACENFPSSSTNVLDYWLYLTNINSNIAMAFDQDRKMRLNTSQPIKLAPNVTMVDCVTFPRETLDLYVNGSGVQLKHFTNLVYHLWTRTANGVKEIMFAKNEPKLNGITSDRFDGKLNGIDISAAFNRTEEAKHFIYFIAGRHVCEVEFSYTEFRPFCQIKDIADYVDCDGGDSRGSILWIVVVVVIALLLLIAIIAVLALMARKAKIEEASDKKSSVGRKTRSKEDLISLRSQHINK